MKKFLITLALICSTGLTTVAKPATKLLTEDQLVKIMVDLELTKTLIYHDIPDDEPLAQQILQAQQALIFEAHAVSQAMFHRSYARCLQNPLKFKKLQEAVITQLEQLLPEQAED